MEIRIQDEQHLEQGAREFLAALGSRRHIALHGEMGAGKTTFTAALCRMLGMDDDVTSPTFSIINEYRADVAGESGIDTVYHFDFYRIEDISQALDLGLDEYFDSDALCLMEWPGNVADLLPDDTLDVTITVNDDGSRTISL